MTTALTSGLIAWKRGRRAAETDLEPHKILRFVPTAPNLSQCSGLFGGNAFPIEAYIHITSPLHGLVVLTYRL